MWHLALIMFEFAWNVTGELVPSIAVALVSLAFKASEGE